jgi:hypothetical protein
MAGALYHTQTGVIGMMRLARMLMSGLGTAVGVLAVAGALMISTPESASAQTCFGCYPGGYGNPVICSAGQHFDQNPGNGYFGGSMHAGCGAGECEVHESCLTSPETVAAVAQAVKRRDVATLKWHVWASASLRLREERGTIEVLGCDGAVTREIKISKPLMKRLLAA